MDLEKCRYVVVEGPIGAGKTSLARQLAHHVDGEELLERPEDNPFLARFYEDMARYALPTQLTFLFQRVDQLRGIGQLDMFRRATVGDFLLDKDPLFARLNLSDAEYQLYEKVYSHLKPQTPVPDLVDLPAGAGRHADRTRAPARRRLRADDLRALPRAPRRRLQPLSSTGTMTRRC